MGLHVVGVRLSLIPYHALDGILSQWQDATLVKVARLVRMTTKVGTVVGEVLCRPSPDPWLYEVVVEPVFQDGGELCLQGVSVYPRFRRRTANGVAYQSHGHFQAIPQHLAIIIGYGGEARGGLRCRGFPSGILEILQVVERVEA